MNAKTTHFSSFFPIPQDAVVFYLNTRGQYTVNKGFGKGREREQRKATTREQFDLAVYAGGGG